MVDAFERPRILLRARAKETAQAERQTEGKKMKQETNSAGSFGGLKLSVDRCIPSAVFLRGRDAVEAAPRLKGNVLARLRLGKEGFEVGAKVVPF